MDNLEQLKFFTTGEHPCSYLNEEVAQTLFLDPNLPVDKQLYSQLLDLGFRRSGEHVYRPYCANCKQCISARIPVNNFKLSRQQKRVAHRNDDIQVSLVTTINTDEYYQLFEKYIRLRHADGDMYPTNLESYRSFLCTDKSYSHYYRFSINDDQLIAVAIADQINQGLSAVYSFYDPDHARRSLGTYMILWQIAQSQHLGLNALYLGYWIKNCQKMRYKADFKPIELYINQRWIRLN